MKHLLLSIMLMLGFNTVSAQFLRHAPDTSAPMPTVGKEKSVCAPDTEHSYNWYEQSRCAKASRENPDVAITLSCTASCKSGYKPAGNLCCSINKKKPEPTLPPNSELNYGYGGLNLGTNPYSFAKPLNPEKLRPKFFLTNCENMVGHKCRIGKKQHIHSFIDTTSSRRKKKSINYCCEYKPNPSPHELVTDFDDLKLLCAPLTAEANRRNPDNNRPTNGVK